MAKKPIPLPVQPVEAPPPEECPKCPPVGAPAWMATFADIAILLMAFFVLILSFAEFNQPKFKMIAGSLKSAFGVQREIPVVEQPRGTTVLELKFSPSPDPSVTRTLRQDTTQIEQPKIKSDVDERQKREQEQKEKTEEERKEEQKRQLAELLQEALQNGALKAHMENGEMVLDYEPQPDSADQQNAQSTMNDTQDGLPRDQQAMLNDTQTGQPMDQNSLGEDQGGIGQDQGLGSPGQTQDQGAEQSEEDLMAELVEQLNALAKNTLESETEGDGAAEGAANHPEGIDGQDTAAIATDRLAVALRRELGEGLVQVEQRGDKVFVTVGAGGAFPSGTADLTAQAREIMDRIAFSAMNEASGITVTGHTDNVPLGGGNYRDNWGLAAARSASVVREFAASGLIDPTKLTATSMGESQPVADNSTAEGREQNRRIEIEISY
ncbi:MAG: OmpA family protein [Thalassovita sp.]